LFQFLSTSALFLLHYQRNVGILEKIVQSLGSLNATTGNNKSIFSETIIQYEAQNHVLSQLESKLQQLLRPPTQTTSTALVKLRRDFERVQIRVSQLQEAATKKISYLQQQQQQSTNSAVNGNISGNSFFSPYPTSSSGMEDSSDSILEQQRMQQQLQLQEDRLNEEIMREREEEIRNINRGMHTVNEIYKDLAHIVGQQQHDIDKIETQMEDSRANAEAGLKQVEKANERYGQGNCSVM
jgi:t-SNARE complex subunit (syntaxin)